MISSSKHRGYYTRTEAVYAGDTVTLESLEYRVRRGVTAMKRIECMHLFTIYIYLVLTNQSFLQLLALNLFSSAKGQQVIHGYCKTIQDDYA